MGLEGSLRDFPLTEILQLLGSQRKTGILTVVAAEDTITVSFHGGDVVLADSEASSLEQRLGNLLIRTGKLAPGELLRALESQKQTHGSLAVILLRERSVSADNLRDALRILVGRIVLPAFRWKDGKFRFNPSAIRHDAALLELPADSLARESVEILEEWPKLERKIPAQDLVLVRAPGVENLRLVFASEPHEGELLVSLREAEAWKWVDGRRRVAEILDRAFLSDLEAYRGLVELLDRNLVVADRVLPAARAETSGRAPWLSIRALGLWVIFLLLSASAVREVPRGRWNVFLAPGENPESESVLSSISL